MKYTIRLDYKILAGLFAFFAYFIVFVTLRSTLENPSWLEALLLDLVILLLATWGVLWAIRSRVIVEEDCVIVRTTFTTNRIQVKDILGYEDTVMGEYRRLNLIPRDRPAERIPLNSKLAHFNDLDQWVTDRFTVLKNSRKTVERQEILDDERYGSTLVNRNTFWKDAGEIANLCHFVAILTLVPALILAWKAPVYLSLILLVPLSGLYVIAHFKGLIRFQTAFNGTAYYTVWPLFIAPTLFSTIGQSADITLIDGSRFTTLYWCLAPLLGIGILIVSRSHFFTMRNRGVALLMIAGTSWLFSYSLVYNTNVYLDTSIPKDISLVITGKERDYFLQLDTANALHLRTLLVPYDLFARMEEGDTLHLPLHAGRWGAAWYRPDEAP